MNRAACLTAVIAFGILISFQIASAEQGVSVELSLLEKVADRQAERVAADTVNVPDDGTFTAQLGNLVFDLQLISTTEEAVVLRIELITAGPRTKRFFSTYTVPFNLPVIIDSVIVRGESIYRASVRPISFCEINNDCRHDVADTTAFRADPAPHFEIYYVKESLGDYHWNAIRAYLEEEGRALDNLCNFGDPQPTSFFILPCKSKSVYFERNTGYAFDPVKNNVMAVYNHQEKDISSLPVNMMKFYRHLGYAPRLFAEGIGSFADFNDFYLKEKEEKTPHPDLRKYFLSDAYLSYPDRVLIRQAAGSFCSYLVKRYGINKFKDFWQTATDLTAANDLLTVYGITADWLIGDWEEYLDTLEIDPGLFQYHSQRDAQIRDYREAVRLLMMRYGAIGGDKELLKDIGNYYYLLGEYEKAQEFFGEVLLQDSVNVSDLLTYANMLLMNGKLDSALTWYNEVISQDSTQNLPYYKIGTIYRYRGDIITAMEYFRKAAALTEDIDIVIDAQLGIGECFREGGVEDSAQAYFASALNGSKIMMVGGDPKPLALMRAGEAFLRLDQPQAAIEHLEFAIFVEERLFYIGRMALALGEAYDLAGNRSAALDSYKLTKSAPGGFLDCERADKYISKPFTLKP